MMILCCHDDVVDKSTCSPASAHSQPVLGLWGQQQLHSAAGCLMDLGCLLVPGLAWARRLFPW